MLFKKGTPLNKNSDLPDQNSNNNKIQTNHEKLSPAFTTKITSNFLYPIEAI
jgi:hypothetical protein